MKKSLFLIMAVLFSLGLFFSCKSDDDDDGPSVLPTFMVSLDANGGTIEDTSRATYTVRYGATLTLPLAADLSLTRSGYYFAGWAETADASGYEYLNGATLRIYSTLKLYAVWQKSETKEIYVSKTGSDSGTGSADAPYASLAKAIKNLSSKYTDYVFYVSGAVSADSEIDFADSVYGSVQANSITIKGKTDSATDSIAGDGAAHSLLSIQTSVPVSVKNITLKGGKGVSIQNQTDGGAVYIAKGQSGRVLVEFENVVFDGNSATNGGAVYINTGSGSVTFSACTFKNNSAEKGGAIYNDEVVEMNGGTISGNTASNGGACYNRGTLSMKAGTVNGNTAEEKGGAIYNSGHLTVTGGTVSANISEDKNGAGIYNIGTLVLNGKVAVTEHSGTGAAVYNDTDGKFTFNAGTISKNTAVSGAVYNAGTMDLAGGEISENTAENGGGIYNAATLTISNGSVFSNAATGNGGGIANIGENARFTFTYGYVQDNRAANGGGVYTEGLFTMSEGTLGNNKGLYGSVINNAATLHGGGVYVKSGSLTVTRGIVSGYGKRTAGNGTIYYSGNQAEANKGNSSDGIYSGSGNAWYSDGGTISIGGEAVTETYSDGDVVVGSDISWDKISE